MRGFNALRRQVVLGHVSGVPVRADYRWFFVIGIMTLLIAASTMQISGEIGVPGALAVGFSATLIFFISIFIHEFAHAAIARTEDLEVVEIVLHPFGGLTRFRHEPETPRAEFRIAIAGPAASFLLSLLFVGIATIGSSADMPILVILGYALALLNFLIAVFNMLPGYPFDGGRVLRAYLWRSGRDLDEATILTGRFGQVIAAALIFFGLIIAIFRLEFFTGFWAVLAGIFLFDSAKKIISEVRASARILVEDAMMLPISVSPETTIHQFVETVLPMNPQAIFPVASAKRLHGMLLLEDMKSIERTEWQSVSVGNVMRPVEGDHFVEVGTPLPDARELARTNTIGLVGVINREGKLVGVIYSSSRR